MVRPLVAGVLGLLWIAILNGYPILFYDSGIYLENALDRFSPVNPKPLGYGWFLYLSSLNLSPWLTATIQATLVAAIIAIFTRRIVSTHLATTYLITIGVVSFLTSAPYFVGQVMPDFFSGVLPILVYLMIVHYAQLKTLERIALTICIFIAVASHVTHVLLVPITALVCFGTLFWLRRRTGTRPPIKQETKGLGVVLGTFALATLAMCVSNQQKFGYFTAAPAGHTFLLARMLADGSALDHLRAVCPDAGYRLCEQIENVPSDSDLSLWGGSLLETMGDWLESRDEARDIIRSTIVTMPARVARDAMSATAKQFVSVGLDPDLLGPLPEGHHSLQQLDLMYPSDSAEFRATLQQRGALYDFGVGLHSEIIEIVFWLSLLICIAFAVRDMRRKADMAVLTATLVGFLVVNAFVCGALGIVDERYQGRVTWPVVLVAALLIARYWIEVRSRERAPTWISDERYFYGRDDEGEEH